MLSNELRHRAVRQQFNDCAKEGCLHLQGVPKQDYLRLTDI